MFTNKIIIRTKSVWLRQRKIHQLMFAEPQKNSTNFVLEGQIAQIRFDQ